MWGFKKIVTKIRSVIPIGIGIIFIALSITVYVLDTSGGFINFLLGLLACCSIVTLMATIYENRRQSVAFGILAKYTMQIFLMHTLFAAPLRTVLMKVGIQNAVIHVILGLAISFIGPIGAAWIMKKMKWPEFFLYPTKFIGKVS